MLKIRDIKENELNILLDLIMDMASYEKLTKDVIASTSSLHKVIFETKRSECALLEVEGKLVGYLMYFYNVSSFTGCANLYIEDIYIKPEFRHNGYGKECFIYLAKKAVKEGCKRIDWVCLDWNQKGLDFYKKMGASRLDMWVLHRLDEDGIKKLAGEE